jgi:SAM-dependent methyltransferase
MNMTNILKKVLKKILPKGAADSLHVSLIYIKAFAVDLFEGITGKRGPMIPPTRYMFHGMNTVADFKKNGEEYFKYYLELGGLRPDDKVLDIGCGIGEKTIPLTRYLNENGKFEGLDIVKRGIDWCNKKITPNYPNFRFHLADVYNKYYNPTGRYKPSEYRFPYDDNTFNLINLVSVFTHMMPSDIENYIKEIARVTNKGGKSIISYFILNSESLRLIDEGRSNLDFKYVRDGCRTTNPDIPEDAVSFPEEYIRSLYVKNNLTIIEPIRYGSWCGRTKFVYYQDLIVAKKG